MLTARGDFSANRILLAQLLRMEITDELMQRFFANQCDPEEFEVVAAYLGLHPEEAEKYMGMEEWEEAGAADAAPGHEEVLESLRQQLFAGEEQTGEAVERPVRVHLMRRLTWTSVAAALILALGGWLWMKNKMISADTTTMAAIGQPGLHRETVWFCKKNTQDGIERVLLPDGSLVKLHGHSSLRYADSFGLTTRESWLDGQADFYVKKEKGHPFTVYAGKLATTALGTTFGVQAAAPAATVTVRLFTGKVVVRPMERLAGWTKDVYLLPGDEMAYDSRRMVATVRRQGTGPAGIAEDSATGGSGDLSFINAPLKKVFHDLSARYHTTIYYTPKDLTGMNFSGTVSRQDSLATIVRLLATMNGLDMQEQPEGIRVTRPKK
jgi:transmembrane sensor